MTTTELVLALLALLFGGGAIMNQIGKMFPQREPASKRRADRIGELERARDSDAKERDKLGERVKEMESRIEAIRAEAEKAVAAARADAHAEVATVRHDLRVLTDYAHDLRQDQIEGRPPPPRDWPEGLKL